ncbi:hypothetical protein BH10BAC3_BH10BAC3_03550 [soil metagenome]
MKQFITLLSIVSIMTACKTSTDKPIGDEAKMLTVSQAADFAEFTALKEQKAAAELKGQNSFAARESKPTVIYVRQHAATRTVYRQPRTVYQTVPATTETVSQPVAKKKMSKALKGAIIGAGTGAVAGAIIGKKNRVLGAVIGGVAGGGVGYGIGRGMDKRDGRTNLAFAGF